MQEHCASLSGEPKLQETTMTIDEIMSKDLALMLLTNIKFLILVTIHLEFGKNGGALKQKNVKSRAVKALLRNAKIRSAIKAEAKKLV